jgi:hypothetical protein
MTFPPCPLFMIASRRYPGIAFVVAFVVPALSSFRILVSNCIPSHTPCPHKLHAFSAVSCDVFSTIVR